MSAGERTGTARWIYRVAGIYGLLVMLPQYFLEGRIGRDTPPPITHPEFFYGFVGITVAWQLAFLLISRDPVRYRPLMPATWLEKLAFGGAVIALALAGRAPAATVLVFAGLDLALGVLFVAAWRATPRTMER